MMERQSKRSRIVRELQSIRKEEEFLRDEVEAAHSKLRNELDILHEMSLKNIDIKFFELKKAYDERFSHVLQELDRYSNRSRLEANLEEWGEREAVIRDEMLRLQSMLFGDEGADDGSSIADSPNELLYSLPVANSQAPHDTETDETLQEDPSEALTESSKLVGITSAPISAHESKLLSSRG